MLISNLKITSSIQKKYNRVFFNWVSLLLNIILNKDKQKIFIWLSNKTLLIKFGSYFSLENQGPMDIYQNIIEKYLLPVLKIYIARLVLPVISAFPTEWLRCHVISTLSLHLQYSVFTFILLSFNVKSSTSCQSILFLTSLSTGYSFSILWIIVENLLSIKCYSKL